MIVKPNKELFKNKLLKQLNNSIYDLYHALNDFNLSHNGILDDDFDYFQRTLYNTESNYIPFLAILARVKEYN